MSLIFCESKFINHINQKNIRLLIIYIETRKIRVGIYAGTFNPITTGHLNIIEKSNKIFDKVIIAFGNNPEKESRNIPFSSIAKPIT